MFRRLCHPMTTTLAATTLAAVALVTLSPALVQAGGDRHSSSFIKIVIGDPCPPPRPVYCPPPRPVYCPPPPPRPVYYCPPPVVVCPPPRPVYCPPPPPRPVYYCPPPRPVVVCPPPRYVRYDRDDRHDRYDRDDRHDRYDRDDRRDPRWSRNTAEVGYDDDRGYGRDEYTDQRTADPRYANNYADADNSRTAGPTDDRNGFDNRRLVSNDRPDDRSRLDANDRTADWQRQQRDLDERFGRPVEYDRSSAPGRDERPATRERNDWQDDRGGREFQQGPRFPGRTSY